jgi:hypothetical protein
MKRIALAAVLALGLFAVTGSKAEASGFGNGTYGISPGSFSVGVGFNVAWSGFSFGQMNGGGGGPCYGPPAGPQMYDAYGYGGHDYYGGGGYPAYGGYYGGYQGGYSSGGPANAPPAQMPPAKPNGQGGK